MLWKGHGLWEDVVALVLEGFGLSVADAAGAATGDEDGLELDRGHCAASAVGCVLSV